MRSLGLLLVIGVFSFACFNWAYLSAQDDQPGPVHCPAKDEACNCDGRDYMSPNHPWKKDKNSLKLTDSPKKLLWFVQVSDIHVSELQDRERVEAFRHFCSDTVKVIRPSVVLASGDLTDAKTEDFVGSRQSVKEWNAYHSAIADSGLLERTVWLDLRGNHDNFNVFDVLSPENHFRKYSIQGRNFLRSYTHTLTHDGDNYTFVALDATPTPGLKKPFNFVGMLLEKEWDIAQKLERDVRCSSYNIWFAHYPTSAVLSPSPGLRWLIRRSLVYLAGHYHTLAGLAPMMHGIHRQHGNLELELADWKVGRKYRVVAIDNGLLSHADVDFERWPVIVVTNPKDARYLLPLHEPLDLMNTSTHIRSLVFSPSAITSVKVCVNSGHWIEMKSTPDNPNLFVAPWNPKALAPGVHNVQVLAEDSNGRSSSVHQQFSLDKTALYLTSGFPGDWMIAGDATFTMQTIFGILVCLAIFPLCGLRLLHYLVLRGKASPSVILQRRNCCFRRLWLLSTIDGLFYPLVLYPLYLIVGPWIVGEIVDGHVGATFAWGSLVSGRYVPPGALTFLFGSLQMIWYQIPLLLLLGGVVMQRYEHVIVGKPLTLKTFLARNIPVILFICLMTVFAVMFGVGFGAMAFFLGPLRTYSVILAIVLWVHALKLEKSSFRRALRIRSMVATEPVW